MTKVNKQWSDQFIPHIKRILGEHLITVAPEEEDAHHCTDLIVLRLDSVRIACRVRRHSYFKNEQYRDEFTIRSGLPNGNKTELAKIMEGWGEFFFYAFSNESETGLQAWALIDLKAFRYWLFRCLYKDNGKLPGVKQHNHDGSSDFHVFSMKCLPSNCVVARSI